MILLHNGIVLHYCVASETPTSSRIRVNEMRMSANTALNGYDYDNQAWYKNGVYIRCGHPEAMDCQCFGKINEGMAVAI